jgi:uncharacterized protein with HEPN domain
MPKAIDRTFLFSPNAYAVTFAEDAIMHYACRKHLETFGEASNQLSPELKLKYLALEWRKK